LTGPRPPGGRKCPRVGLLGGSFNPAHDGHLHVSRLAITRLRLDQVWWLVSPQNPLKPEKGMASPEDRLRGAREMAEGLAGWARPWVSDLERELGTVYTADTLAALKRRYPEAQFVWIMGADNMMEVSRWHAWTAIFEAVPIAVFARPSYSLRALASTAAKRYARDRVAESRAGVLAAMEPPAWAFLHTPLNAASATGIRAGDRKRR